MNDNTDMNAKALTNTQDTSVAEVDQTLESVLQSLDTDLQSNRGISIPVAQLSTLGAGVSSLIPAFRTVASAVTIDTGGLFRVANQNAGDVLKMAKDGTYWGAMKTADKASKMAKLQQVESISETAKSVTAFNTATIMMAAALLSIEKQLGNIQETQEQILSLIRFDKESKIEGTAQQLLSLLKKYKYSWDNEKFIQANAGFVESAQQSSRADILSLQKEISHDLGAKQKQLVVIRTAVDSKASELIKKFQYYRLSVFNFSLASLLEVLLTGNFKEEYICEIRSEIEKVSADYRHAFDNGSRYLEKMSKMSVETNLLKNVGKAGNAAGKFIGSIPIIEKGPVDELLCDSGSKLQQIAEKTETNVIGDFGKLGNPNTGVFTKRLTELNTIYNHTSKIKIEKDRIMLIEE